jgi:hypothetical protein
LTPLDYFLSVLRDETATRAERMEAAAKAAPYVHPRLAAIEHTGAVPVEEPIDLSDLNPEEREMLRQILERRLKNGTGGDDQPGQNAAGYAGSASRGLGRGAGRPYRLLTGGNPEREVSMRGR